MGLRCLCECSGARFQQFALIIRSSNRKCLIFFLGILGWEIHLVSLCLVSSFFVRSVERHYVLCVTKGHFGRKSHQPIWGGTPAHCIPPFSLDRMLRTSAL